MRRSLLALVLVAATALGTGGAHAASGTLITFKHPDPVSGAGCERSVTVGYDTNKVPPVWSSGYVTCS